MRQGRFLPRLYAGAVLTSALLLTMLVLIPMARAAVTCAFDLGTATATISFGAGDSITLSRSGNNIRVNGASCQTGADIATVLNTDDIVLTGTATGNETVTLDVSSGQFEPGASQSGDPGNNPDEIEIDLGDLDVGTDTVIVVGSSAVPPPDGAGDDVFYVSDTGIDLNGDGEDEDATFSNVESVTVNAGAGDDEVDASAVAAMTTVLNGGDGFDGLYGGALNDTLNGGNDDDWLWGGDGNDAVNGDAGFDFADYTDAVAAVTVDLQGNQTATGGAGSDALSGIEGVWGSAFGDTISGAQNGDEWIAGNDGDDTLDGRGGDDTVDYSEAGGAVTVDLAVTAAQNTGGAGTDTLAGFENVFGSAFGDTLKGTTGDNVITGGAGSDVLDGLGGFDIADYSDFGGPGPGGVTVSLAVTTAQSTGHGTDTLAGFEGIWGSGFNDTLIGDDGDNELDGWDGVDTTSYAAAADAVLVDLFNEYAEGGGGADGLYGFENVTGSDFDDWIGGTDENNVLAGGAGNDTVDYSMASAGVTVDLSVVAAQVTGGAGTDTLTGFENLSGSLFDDELTGEAGDNWFIGWTGDDTIDGGAGSDTVDYSMAGDAETVDLITGTASGGDGEDGLSGIENVVGSGFDDFISGDAEDNELDGGDGVDTLSYQLAGVAVTVDLRAGVATGHGTDLLAGFENVKGSTLADTIYGDGGSNKLQGSLGNDAVFGRGGADNLGGSDGDDTLRGGSGDDRLKGGRGDDFLAGGRGRDVCKPGPGNDTEKGCEK